MSCHCDAAASADLIGGDGLSSRAEAIAGRVTHNREPHMGVLCPQMTLWDVYVPMGDTLRKQDFRSHKSLTRSLKEHPGREAGPQS